MLLMMVMFTDYGQCGCPYIKHSNQVVSRVSALNHMVRNGYTREEIEKVRQGLKTFGWRTDPSLPPGFLTRCVG